MNDENKTRTDKIEEAKVDLGKAAQPGEHLLPCHAILDNLELEMFDDTTGELLATCRPAEEIAEKIVSEETELEEMTRLAFDDKPYSTHMKDTVYEPFDPKRAKKNREASLNEAADIEFKPEILASKYQEDQFLDHVAGKEPKIVRIDDLVRRYIDAYGDRTPPKDPIVGQIWMTQPLGENKVMRFNREGNWEFAYYPLDCPNSNDVMLAYMNQSLTRKYPEEPFEGQVWRDQKNGLHIFAFNKWQFVFRSNEPIKEYEPDTGDIDMKDTGVLIYIDDGWKQLMTLEGNQVDTSKPCLAETMKISFADTYKEVPPTHLWYNDNGIYMYVAANAKVKIFRVDNYEKPKNPKPYEIWRDKIENKEYIYIAGQWREIMLPGAVDYRFDSTSSFA